MSKLCRVCGDVLIVGANWYPSHAKTNQMICKDCRRAYQKQATPPMRRSQLFNENRGCPLFLGVHVAERILSHIFKDVERMPFGNPGYDIICNQGKLVDVKASCRRYERNGAYRWQFNIGKNQIADYFLCLAFDNRKDLNPEHIWLIPADNINHQLSVSIATTKIPKWSKYEIDKLRDVVSCCSTMRC